MNVSVELKEPHSNKWDSLDHLEFAYFYIQYELWNISSNIFSQYLSLLIINRNVVARNSFQASYLTFDPFGPLGQMSAALNI